MRIQVNKVIKSIEELTIVVESFQGNPESYVGKTIRFDNGKSGLINKAGFNRGSASFNVPTLTSNDVEVGEMLEI
jgi:hypothetical protein